MKSNTTENSQSLTLLFLIILIVPALFYQTTLNMAEVWWVNETFTHGFLIFPITLWLIFDKKDYLSKLYPAPEPLVLIITFLLMCLWLISALTDVKVIMQLNMISIILTLIWAFLGRTIFIYLLFPLLFLYLAVPLGQGLIPILMDFTANATVSLVRLTGIPIYQDGLNFILPSGSWSIVEECSGVRYLIATITLGIVYAYLNYATSKKRLIFIAFAIIVPIFANSLRAFIIVMLGHFSGMKIATGADHLIYGWVFFGIIIFTMFYIGSFWRDSKDEFDNKAPAAEAYRTKTYSRALLAISLIVIFLFQILFYQLQSRAENVQNSANNINIIDHYGPWQRQTANKSIWQPILHQPDLTLSENYDASDASVQLDIGYFHSQRDGSETVSSNNKLVNPYGGEWKIVSSSIIDTGEFPVLETTILRSNKKLLTWQWYRMGNLQTCSPYKAKIYQAYMQITADRTDGAYITLSTPLDEDKKAARKRLSSFFSQSIDDINHQLDEARKNNQQDK
ncbi:MAG TPA: exosortase A [Gammaproteobacteria bacterium]|nr:exosortase A [Gammaproteobacteria bacterium]